MLLSMYSKFTRVMFFSRLGYGKYNKNLYLSKFHLYLLQRYLKIFISLLQLVNPGVCRDVLI